MITKNCQSESVRNKLDEGFQLRPYPRVVSRLQSAIKNPESSVHEIAEILESDIALSTKILRLANSPIYGLKHEIRSIEHSVALLGRNPIKNMAIAYAGSVMFSNDKASSKQHDALWVHSLGCATTAKLLSSRLDGVCPDEAFLAGIFHDIGKLFFLEVAPKEYATITSQAFGEEFVRQETDLFGIAHDEAGLKLMVTWPVPDAIKIAVRYHHSPSMADGNTKLAKVVNFSDRMARSFGIGSDQDTSIDVSDEITETFGFDEESLEAFHEEAFGLFQEVSQAYSN